MNRSYARIVSCWSTCWKKRMYLYVNHPGYYLNKMYPVDFQHVYVGSNTFPRSHINRASNFRSPFNTCQEYIISNCFMYRVWRQKRTNRMVLKSHNYHHQHRLRHTSCRLCHSPLGNRRLLINISI